MALTFVHKCKGPVFLACHRRTGRRVALPDAGPALHRAKRGAFTFTNGTHIDSLDPATFNRWFDFLELYVARRAPNLSPALKGLARGDLRDRHGRPRRGPARTTPIRAGPPTRRRSRRTRRCRRSGSCSTTAPAARRARRSRPLSGRSRAGRCRGRPAVVVPGHGRLAAALPREGRGRGRLHLGSRGARGNSFTSDTGSGGLWRATPVYRWPQPPAGSALSYVSEPWIARRPSWAPARCTPGSRHRAERRPAGHRVEGAPRRQGDLRAERLAADERRKLDERRSTFLEPVPSLRERDDRPLPEGRYVKIVVPLYYQGHVHRAGSRIRLVVSAPGGDQPVSSPAARGRA